MGEVVTVLCLITAGLRRVLVVTLALLAEETLTDDLVSECADDAEEGLTIFGFSTVVDVGELCFSLYSDGFFASRRPEDDGCLRSVGGAANTRSGGFPRMRGSFMAASSGSLKITAFRGECHLMLSPVGLVGLKVNNQSYSW